MTDLTVDSTARAQAAAVRSGEISAAELLELHLDRIEERNPELLSTLDDRFGAVDTLLEKHRKGDGFKLYTELSKTDVKELSDAIDALGEPISQVAEVVSGQ